jgi:hypothetical protein
MTRRKPNKTETPTPAPIVRTDAQRILAEKRAALAQAQRDLAASREAYDEHGVVAAQSTISALHAIVADLEQRHAGELEEAAHGLARRWIEAQNCDEIVRNIGIAQQKALDAIEAAIMLIEAEARERRRLRHIQSGHELLVMRWPELGRATNSQAPSAPDYIGRVATAASGLMDRYRPLTVAGITVSSTEQQRRRATLRTLYAHLDKRRAQVPQDVRSIIEAAPRPPELEETPEVRSRRESAELRRGREAGAMGQAVGTATRALAGLAGGSGVSGL